MRPRPSAAPAMPGLSRALGRVSMLLLLSVLAACGGRATGYHADGYSGGGRGYAPPGPEADPWGPYIHEATHRFGVPERWIRAVMRQESGGRARATSPAGAMGLMQVMPDTYAGLRERYGLGDDPYDPHDNIMAGAGYIREMYDHYGSPGFLAAYNAGPNRLDDFLATGDPLPRETVNYVASVAPHLGTGAPTTGPLAAYAEAGSYGAGYEPPPPPITIAVTPAGKPCNPNAAYDPARPCRALPPVPAPAPRVVLAAAAAPPAPGRCDPDAAYDPAAPCTARSAWVAASAPVAAPARPMPVVAAAAQAPGGCDPDAAYDPDAPCTTPPTRVAMSAPIAPPAEPIARPVPILATAAPYAGRCDQNSAYDPNMPCTPLPPPVPMGAVAAAAPAYRHYPDYPAPYPERVPMRFAPPRPQPQPAVAPVRPRLQLAAISVEVPAAPAGRWSIQVGAFSSPGQARATAEAARISARTLLGTARIALPVTTPFGGGVLYRARLTGLLSTAAEGACARLAEQRTPCIVVPPGEGS